MCVVLRLVRKPDEQPYYEEIGRTETIQNSLNPQWNKKIYVNYYFEEKQQLRFELYDIDSPSQELTHHDFLGRADTELADIVAGPYGTLTLNLTGLSPPKGQLTIRAEEVDEGQKESAFFVCHGRGLDKKDFFGKSDPFLEFRRQLGDGTYQMVHRTEFIKKTLNPEWKPFEIPVRLLCHGNKDKEFRIDCYDYDKDGGHDFIGSCQVTLNALSSGRVKDLPLVNPKKAKKKGAKYKNSGILHFLSVDVRREYTFLEFISGGLQLDFAVSVDFTASNGAVHNPPSLHYISSNAPNQYQMAIRAVLEICEHYNKTKLFESVGFGAKIPPDYAVSHLFPLNVRTLQRQVHGVDGVMESYRECLAHTQLYGPTNFAPTIEEFARKAANFPADGSRYQILLIITDGVITDMVKTKMAIVQASSLPLSIIIVGVGNDSFEKMDELDSDDQLLSVNGRIAKRDIVQFVPFRNFINRSTSLSPAQQAHVQSMLAKEVCRL
ncbi:Copine-8 [Aphelenchoides avenae]|nr:Copine-8 [Aphelenchus avenae]